QTIHKLLGTIQNSVTFRHNAQNPLPYDLIIIDESSMIDAALMSKLLDSVGSESRIILLGDRNQLVSVEAGSIFGDLCLAKECDLLQNRITEFTFSHRFKEELGIGKLSKAVLNGEQHTIKEELTTGSSDEITYDFQYSESLFKQYALLYKGFITAANPKEALKSINEIRFLCATRDDVKETNRRIEKILADENIAGFNPTTEFYINRPIMITRNDYILDLRNGDIGIIRKATNESGHESTYAFFESNDPEKPKKIPVGLLPEHETVFAMTIHKSQGSEFTNVAVILPKDGVAEQLLTRELFYTAVTRAKKQVLVQSDRITFDNCFKKSVTRSSGIGSRLSNSSNNKEI
ncbi:MAG: AAA family ATPase, partial [Bacteroidales bacterium]